MGQGQACRDSGAEYRSGCRRGDWQVGGEGLTVNKLLTISCIVALLPDVLAQGRQRNTMYNQLQNSILS